MSKDIKKDEEMPVSEDSKENEVVTDKDTVAEGKCAKKQSPDFGVSKVVLCMILILSVLVGYTAYEVELLKQKTNLEMEILRKDVNKTYIYNMEAVLLQTGMAEENRKFETEMKNLEKEISAAERKVKSMKDKKLQQEYRNMYLKSLTLKRNNLVEEHEKFMKSLLKNVNKTMVEVAQEQNIGAVFSNKSVIFGTDSVVDITPVVAKKLQEKMDED